MNAGLVLPMFVQAMMSTIRREWVVALKDFDVLLQTDKIPLGEEQAADGLSLVVPLCSTVNPDSPPHATQSNNEVHPPSKLLMFPPVATIVNVILTGLNRVRACPIKSLCPLIEHELRSEEHTSELQSLMRISYAV